MKTLIILIMIFMANINIIGQNIDPDKHIYEAERLSIIKDTITLTGKIMLTHPEIDGDYHIRMKIDSGSVKLSRKNYTNQDSCIVLEIVCAKEAIFPISCNCKDYLNKIQVPIVGERIRVTGRLVFDKRHRWTELHSVYSINKIPSEVADK